jgi:hypothetical protein
LHDQVCKSQVIEYAYSDGSVEYTCTHIQQPNGLWVYINGKLDSLSDLCYRMRTSRNPDQGIINYYTQLQKYVTYYWQGNGTMYVW